MAPKRAFPSSRRKVSQESVVHFVDDSFASADSDHLTVDLNGKWQLSPNIAPANSMPLGTVASSGSDTGALVPIKSNGFYVQANAGTIRIPGG